MSTHNYAKDVEEIILEGNKDAELFITSFIANDMVFASVAIRNHNKEGEPRMVGITLNEDELEAAASQMIRCLNDIRAANKKEQVVYGAQKGPKEVV